VGYDDLVTDPIGAVRSIYEHGGEELSADAERAMRGYLAEHPHGEHGQHRYDLDALGLDANRLRDRFAAYERRFAAESASTPPR
jgi:hypothetical protein